MDSAPRATALSALQALTKVDCDTLDAEVPRLLGPFVNCTSNQAIAYFELLKPEHKPLLSEAVILAQSLISSYSSLKVEELAAQIAMVKLSLRIAPWVTEYLHVQTNPYNSYSIEKTIADAERIVKIFKLLDPAFDISRICIKIPSTWEGIQACRNLEAKGIRTLATTLFTFEQAILAAEAGCLYIAPYVNELRVHFDPEYRDTAKLLDLCVTIQSYYLQHGIKTQVLPASLTGVDEIFALSGVQQITIAPGLLNDLSRLPPDVVTGSMFAGTKMTAIPKISYINNESDFRIAFTRNLKGKSELKLIQAINIFCDMQDKMEAIMKEISVGLP